MAENIKLAEFDIDIDAVVKSAAELKKAIDEIKKAQKENARVTDEQNQEYVENEAALKALNKEYGLHIKALADNMQATADATNRQDLLNVALSQEVTTIAEAREQNKTLNKLRNEANATTAQGQEEIKRLNAALDANNDFIKDNVDALSQQKINVGNYTESINESIRSMNPFNQSITVFITNVQEAGGVTQFFSKSMKSLATAIGGVTKAALAFLATPIGLVLGAIGLALGLIVNSLTSTQEGMDKVTAVTRPLVAVFEVLLGVLQDLGLTLVSVFSEPLKSAKELGAYIKETLTKQFEALYDIAVGFVTFDFKQMQKGLESASNQISDSWGKITGAADKFVDKIKEGVRLGEELDRLTKEYETVQIRNAELLPRLNAQLKEFNKIAEDTTKTAQERNDAAQKAILASQEINKFKREELTLELDIAKNQAARNDTSRADELEMAQIKGKINEADAAAAEQQTTLQNKVNTIRKEGLALAQKAIDLQIAKQKELLDLFIAEQGERARTLADELALEESISEKRKQLLADELKAKKISQEAYQKELILLDADLARRRAELSVDNAMREIEANKMALDRRREDAQFLSAELAEQRKIENANILLQEQQLAALRLEQGLINQQQFDDAIRELSETNRIANKAIDDQRIEIEKKEAIERRAIEFQDELAKLQEDGATKFEIQQAQLAEQRELEQNKLAEQYSKGLVSEELYNERILAINRKFDRIRIKNEEDNEKALSDQRLKIADSMFGALGKLADKNSSFGKALAISRALINTFQGITSALAAPFPISIAAAVAAAATGFAAVQNIVKTKVPSVDGGNVADTGGAAVGDMKALAGNQSNLTAVAGSGNAAVQQQIEDKSIASGLTESVSNAVREGAAQGTAQGSEQGLTNLSDNRAIQKSSTF